MARKALGRGLDALIPNADKLLERESRPRAETTAGRADTKRGATTPMVEASGEGATTTPVTDEHASVAGASVAVVAVAGAHAGANAGVGEEQTRETPAAPEEQEPERSTDVAKGGAASAIVPPAPISAHVSTTAQEQRPTATRAAVLTAPPPTGPSGRRALASGRASAVIEVALDRIEANPYQPREHFNEEELQELVNSIISKGVLQPVLVRRRGVGYELIAGERRLRAARRAGLNTIPTIVRDAQDDEMLEIAIIENQQRVDLNPIEAAEAYSRAVDEFGLSTEELATVVGKDRSSVANLIRLLQLPEEVKNLLRQGQLGMGHGRALLGIKTPTRAVALARRAARLGMSVRAVEKLAREPGKRPSRQRRVDPELSRFEDRLRQRFATQVRIQRRGERGRVEIEFYNQEDLERILDELNVLSQG